MIHSIANTKIEIAVWNIEILFRNSTAALFTGVTNICISAVPWSPYTVREWMCISIQHSFFTCSTLLLIHVGVVYIRVCMPLSCSISSVVNLTGWWKSFLKMHSKNLNNSYSRYFEVPSITIQCMFIIMINHITVYWHMSSHVVHVLSTDVMLGKFCLEHKTFLVSVSTSDDDLLWCPLWWMHCIPSLHFPNITFLFFFFFLHSSCSVTCGKKRMNQTGISVLGTTVYTGRFGFGKIQ